MGLISFISFFLVPLSFLYFLPFLLVIRSLYFLVVFIFSLLSFIYQLPASSFTYFASISSPFIYDFILSFSPNILDVSPFSILTFFPLYYYHWILSSCFYVLVSFVMYLFVNFPSILPIFILFYFYLHFCPHYSFKFNLSSSDYLYLAMYFSSLC